jgi:hypothetical protein
MNAAAFSPLALFHQQMALERIGVDSRGRLYRLPGDNPDGINRVMTAHLRADEFVAYVRDDLRDELVEELRRLTAQEMYENESRVLAILDSARPPWRVALALSRIVTGPMNARWSVLAPENSSWT